MTRLGKASDEANPIIAEAVQRLIVDAQENHVILRCGSEASRLAAEHPDSGMSSGDIADLLLRAAMDAGVPVQMTSTDGA